MEAILHNITSNTGSFMFLMIFGMGGLIAMVAILFGTLSKVASTKEREQSRREIAAYIAEGSISPEDGERLLNAGQSYSKGCRG